MYFTRHTGLQYIWVSFAFIRGPSDKRRLSNCVVDLVYLGSPFPHRSRNDASPQTCFPRWTSPDDNIDGILLLGGSVARIIEAAKLFHRFPNARLIAVTGAPEMGETAVTLDLLSQLGVDVNRVELDGTSHNTFENAEAAKRIAKPRPGDHWLLVTSALHMPRAMGCFRSVGFDVEPYPVDYRHSAAPRLWAHEFIGLAGYWLTGRSTSLWPGP